MNNLAFALYFGTFDLTLGNLKWKIISPFFISLIYLMKTTLYYIINLIVLWYISFFEIT